MSDIAIRVEGLSKVYQLGAIEHIGFYEIPIGGLAYFRRMESTFADVV